MQEVGHNFVYESTMVRESRLDDHAHAGMPNSRLLPVENAFRNLQTVLHDLASRPHRFFTRLVEKTINSSLVPFPWLRFLGSYLGKGKTSSQNSGACIRLYHAWNLFRDAVTPPCRRSLTGEDALAFSFPPPPSPRRRSVESRWSSGCFCFAVTGRSVDLCDL